MLNSTVTTGLVYGFSELMQLLLMSLTLFADDTIIFYDNDCEHIVNLHGILLWFEAVSGLTVNLTKSSIFPIR